MSTAALALSALALVSTVGFNGGSALTAAASPAGYFPPTGHSVGGAFLAFFDRYGGVRVFGYPISEEINEGGRTVQYFERERFEYHPEFKGTSYEVELGQLGVELGRGKVPFAPVAPFASSPDMVYFPQTGHSLGGAFLNFWRANGDVRVLGYPVSEPVNVGGLTVQYFERARMEYHPDKAATGYGVELGLLGREYVQGRPNLAAIIADSAKVVPPSGITLTPRESAILDLINKARQGAGLGTVAVDARLTSLARSRSLDMATRNYFSHTTPEGSDFLQMLMALQAPFKYAGEIISMNNFGPDLTVQKTFDWWMASAEHRPFIMDPRFQYAGVGEALSSSGYHYYTVIFVWR